MKTLFLTVLFSILLIPAFSQNKEKKVELALHLSLGGDALLPEKALTSWFGNMQERFESVFKNEKQEYILTINVKVTSSAPPIMVPHLKPCNDELLQQVKTSLSSLSDLRCEKGYSAFNLMYKINGDTAIPAGSEFCPALDFHNPFGENK